MGTRSTHWRNWTLRAVAAAAGLLLLLSGTSAPVTAGATERTLWLYHTHTHEEGRFTYWRNGQYDQAVLAKLNIFLADWRNHKPTHMDPHLFDLLWAVYRDVGGTQPYNIVSAYRTPETNAYLRSRSSAVAEKSQHMLGHAMDVFIPGVQLSSLRSAAMRHQVGGVGYYPTSGSPFVHMDVGSVRAWPRMTRAQLKTVFPDGRTLHLPVDGTPLSQSGRLYAQAQWDQCHMVPCSGVITPTPAIGGNGGEIQLASLDPAERTVSTIAIVAPTPFARPAVSIADYGDDSADDEGSGAPAIVPFDKTATMMVATRDTFDGQSALSAINRTLDAPIPAPRSLLSATTDMVTAYAADIVPDPGAQRALRMIIERETTGAAPKPAPPLSVDTAGLRSVSVGGTTGLSVSSNFFDMTWTAVTQAGGHTGTTEVATATIDRDPLVGLKERNVDLVAPEIDHVNETLATPLPMTDMHYAELYEPEGYLDNAAELGPLANRIHLESDLTAPPRYDRFIVRSPMLIAAKG